MAKNKTYDKIIRNITETFVWQWQMAAWRRYKSMESSVGAIQLLVRKW